AALLQRFVDETEFAVFEVAQSAVNELRGDAAGSSCEVRPVDQGHTQPAQCRVEGHTGTGNASSEDEKIELAVSKSIEVAIHGRPCRVANSCQSRISWCGANDHFVIAGNLLCRPKSRPELPPFSRILSIIRFAMDVTSS